MKSRIFFLFVLISSLSFATDNFLIKRNSHPLDAEADFTALETWETPISGFFIRSHFGAPVVDTENFAVVIDGLVEKPITLTLKDIKSLPQKSVHAVLECSGNGRALHKPTVPGVQWAHGAVGNAEWTGISVADLLAKVGVKPEARFATVEGADRPQMPTMPHFIRSIPLEKMRDKNTILAWQMNREPMPVLHGGPVRLVLPGWYGENWTKWITHITLTAQEDQGFFMKKGYRMPKTPVKPGEKWDSSTGTPVETLLVQSFIVTPRPDSTVGVGEISVAGKAFSGSGPIVSVEMSTDGGKHWSPAKVAPPHADGGWQEFTYAFQAKKPGHLILLSRATDSAGNKQPLEPVWNPGGYLRNWTERVSLTVSKTAPVVAESLLEERCLTCHTREMFAYLRLPSADWEKTVSKMQHAYGLVLTPEEHATLVQYLSESFSPKTPPAQPARTEYSAEAELIKPHTKIKGNPARGVELYTASCASCHGAQGEGKIGPRLKGRFVTESNFWASVINGRHDMPSFGDALTVQEIADIRAFLNRPLND